MRWEPALFALYPTLCCIRLAAAPTAHYYIDPATCTTHYSPPPTHFFLLVSGMSLFAHLFLRL
ncbi:hypothetical protein DFH06DRAFT_1194185 [Mycena polygramma]|nr:hypothetical protein DFH06DRAFT_1194185 [Mycena polygramma]